MKCLFILFFLPVLAWAGVSRVGNGGDVVYCQHSQNRPTLQQLDFYELSFYDGQEAILGSPTDSPIVKVGYVINWIRQFSPVRADLYNERLQNFMSRVSWSQEPLVDIPDSQHIVLPVNCEVRQLAIQDHAHDPVHYTIDKTLWDQMDNTSRAGLILHEIVYEEALRNKHENSINARSLVRFLVRRKTAIDATYWNFNKNLLDRNFKLYLELPFNNGDSGIFANELSEQSTDGDPYNDTGYFCGYRISGAQEVDYCSEPAGKKNRFKIYSVKNRARILKIYTFNMLNEDPVYIIPPEEVEIPFPVLDYVIPKRIKPSNDINFQNDILRVSCAKAKWIDLSDNFGNESNFDLNIQYPTGCKLASDSSAPHINIQNSWRSVIWPVKYMSHLPRFQFAVPEVIRIFSQSLKVLEAEFSDKKVSVYPAEDQSLKIQSSNCTLMSDSFVEIDQLNRATSLNKIDCKIPINNIDIFWSEVTLDEWGSSVSEGRLSFKAQKLAVVIRQCPYHWDKPNDSLPIVGQGTYQVPGGQYVKKSYKSGFVLETCNWRL